MFELHNFSLKTIIKTEMYVLLSSNPKIMGDVLIARGAGSRFLLAILLQAIANFNSNIN